MRAVRASSSDNVGGQWAKRVGAAVLAVGLLAACDSASGAPTGEFSPAGNIAKSPSAPPTTLALTAPANKATKVLTSSVLTFATNGALETVTLTGTDGKPVPGNVATDRKSWVPARQLAYSTTYKVVATASQGSGNSKSVTSTFTTMAKPYSITGADLYVNDGDTVGVGLPIVVEFTNSIPKAQRAAVEKRLFVTSTPAVEGSWHWFAANEIHYRPRDYWPTGTKVSVRLAIGGLPMGNGNYGKRDRFATFTVGRAVTSKIVNKEKTMYVYRDGKLLRKFPISLGKRSTPTSSGRMVAMEKAYQKTFDSGTFGVPSDSPDGYRQVVYYDVRFTWGGEFVHAAPWSVGSQGRENVSHGCVNASTANASWFYELTLKGDPIEVVGTEVHVEKGNGWTDWELSWEEYKAGSAIK
ncbi:L,D-transpeptidase [Cryptosporangium aurantiacum]|uniref:Lipoprotein-anchoring transpeptidase ErfK/SrfK n=1 Tax=Cryptosporangium aurantiacum TaxID=134849 RepID=A0A1M7Q9R8_9ACTN|nr:Ig-like domain-containing protein [Cryptosporangium aurantiacum]SHN27459.1 Lipoprotein-anchoring transpeptidase ErfK/SrfK [Cryptosporangium aurantiacum]